MTVLSQVSTVSYATDGATTGPFTIPFYFLDNADLVVYTTIGGARQTLALGSDYTVTGAGNPSGGTVSTLTAAAAGTITIERDPPIIQPAAYQDHGRFPAASHERALDRRTMVEQWLARRISGHDTDFAAVHTELGGIQTNLTGVHTELGSIETNLSSIHTELDDFEIQEASHIAGVNNRIDVLTFTHGNIPVLVLDPALANTSTNASAALAAITALGRSVYIPAGDFRIASNTVVPKGVYLLFDAGARLVVDSGVTLSIYGSIDLNISRQIFAGAGHVVGLRVNRPEWWGARNTYDAAQARDDEPAFQAAMTSAKASFTPGGEPSDGYGRARIVFAGFYYFARTLHLYPDPNINLGFIGNDSLNGGVISPSGNVSFTGAALIEVHGQALGTFSGSDIDFRDFQLSQRTGSGCTIGLSFVPEGAGYALGGASTFSPVENILVTGFPTGIQIQNTEKLQFNRVSVFGVNKSCTTGIKILVSGDAAAFTGDLNFYNLNIAIAGHSFTPADHSGLCDIWLYSNNPSGAQIKGVRIHGDIYPAEDYVKIEAQNGGIIGDLVIGLPGSEFDGFAGRRVNVISNNAGGQPASSIENIMIGPDVYFRGSNAGYPMVQLAATGTSEIKSVIVNGNWFANCGDTVLSAFNIEGLSFNNNNIAEPYGNLAVAAVALTSVTQVTINSNNLHKKASTGFFTSLLATAADVDYLTFNGNMIGPGTISVTDFQNGNSGSIHIAKTGNAT
jgi:hypothetical protein